MGVISMLGVIGDIQIVTGAISSVLGLVKRVYDQVDQMKNNKDFVLSFKQKLGILSISLEELKIEQLTRAHQQALKYLEARITESSNCINNIEKAKILPSLWHANEHKFELDRLSREITDSSILLITAMNVYQINAIDTWQQRMQERQVIGIDLATATDRARSGDQSANDSQYKLGKYYEHYEHGDQNQNRLEAFKWYVMAANNHHNDAQYHLAEAFENGNYRLGIVPNLEISLLWYEKAASEGCQSANVAQYRLAEAYREGLPLVGGERNSPRALSLYNRAAERDHCDAQTFLAKAYEYGNEDLGVEINVQKAFGWYSRAANNSSLCANVAQYRLGLAYDKGDKLVDQRKDIDIALKWYRRASDNNHDEARRVLESLGDVRNRTRPGF